MKPEGVELDRGDQPQDSAHDEPNQREAEEQEQRSVADPFDGGPFERTLLRERIGHCDEELADRYCPTIRSIARSMGNRTMPAFSSTQP